MAECTHSACTVHHCFLQGGRGYCTLCGVSFEFDGRLIGMESG